MELKITSDVLAQRQAYPLDLKVDLSLQRIRHWYERYSGQVYVAFSGGKDSTALLHLVRSRYPDVPGVFIDTGLEYPEIRDFVRTVPNVTRSSTIMDTRSSARWSLAPRAGFAVRAARNGRGTRRCTAMSGAAMASCPSDGGV